MPRIEIEQETDGRWLAEIVELPGGMCYGTARAEVLARVEALALRVSTTGIAYEGSPESRGKLNEPVEHQALQIFPTASEAFTLESTK